MTRHGRPRRRASPTRSSAARRWRSSAITTSTAPAARRCSASSCAPAACRPCIHIPDRITEGYGPNVEAIRALAGQGARLLVTVDCGTASHEPLAEARAARARCGRARPSPGARAPAGGAALVNPNRQDDLSGLGHLCAAGVVFLTLVALNRALRERGFWTARPAPDLLAGARSRRARDRRRRRAADRAQPRLRAPGPRRSCAAASGPGSRRCSTSRRSTRRARMLASRLSARPAHQCRRAHRRCGARRAAAARPPTPVEAGAHRGRARPAQPRAAGDRAGGRGRGGGRRPLATLDRDARARAVLVAGSADWHPGHRRPRRGAPEGALPPAGLRLRAQRRTGRRHRLGPLGRRASISAAPCAPPSRPGSRIEGRRPRHGGRRHAAGGRARRASTAFLGERLADAVGDAQRLDALADRRRADRRRRRPEPRRGDRAGGTVRRRAARAGLRLRAPSPGRSPRGRRRRPCPRQAARRRRRDARRHRLPGRRPAARTRAAQRGRRLCTSPAPCASIAGAAASASRSASRDAATPAPRACRGCGRASIGRARRAAPSPSTRRPSSSGLGRRPFTAKTRVRVPLGAPAGLIDKISCFFRRLMEADFPMSPRRVKMCPPAKWPG